MMTKKDKIRDILRNKVPDGSRIKLTTKNETDIFFIPSNMTITDMGFFTHICTKDFSVYFLIPYDDIIQIQFTYSGIILFTESDSI